MTMAKLTRSEGIDSIATNGDKHRPLDDAEIQRLCKRFAEIETKRNAARLRHSVK
jgi:hypothetical protein